MKEEEKKTKPFLACLLPRFQSSLSCPLGTHKKTTSQAAFRNSCAYLWIAVQGSMVQRGPTVDVLMSKQAVDARGDGRAGLGGQRQGQGP